MHNAGGDREAGLMEVNLEVVGVVHMNDHNDSFFFVA